MSGAVSSVVVVGGVAVDVVMTAELEEAMTVVEAKRAAVEAVETRRAAGEAGEARVVLVAFTGEEKEEEAVRIAAVGVEGLSEGVELKEVRRGGVKEEAGRFLLKASELAGVESVRESTGGSLRRDNLVTAINAVEVEARLRLGTLPPL